jgi:hypothetical protein
VGVGLVLGRGNSAVGGGTPRETKRADTSIKIRESRMSSLSSKFKDTREISSEQSHNTTKKHENPKISYGSRRLTEASERSRGQTLVAPLHQPPSENCEAIWKIR